MRPLVLVLALAPAAALAAPEPESSPESYHDRLERLQRAVDDLKARLFVDKVKIDDLKRRVLEGGSYGLTRATLVHRNSMGPTYKLVQVTLALDGAEIVHSSNEEGLLPRGGELTLYDGPLDARAHTLSYTLLYRGEGALFRYLSSYRFTVRGGHSFTLPHGRHTRLELIGRERGNPITTPMEDRPSVDIRTTLERP